MLKIDGLGSSAMGDLTDATVNDYPNITRLVSGLENMGLVVREPNPEDRRSFQVCLTEQGERFVDGVYPDLVEAKERFFDGMDRRDVQTLVELLQRLEANLE